MTEIKRQASARAQLRWEYLKAVAAFVTAVAAVSGIILGVAHLLR